MTAFQNSRFRVIIFTLILLVFFPERPTAQTVLRLNHQFPPTVAGSRIDQWFADQVETRTGGELAIRIFWSNGLGEPLENLGLLKSGHIEMAAMSAGYFPEELPLFSAPNSIPMGLDDVCQSAALMEAFMERVPGFREEAARNGIRPLFFHLLNPYLLVSKKPVTSLAGLAGMRIRTWGKDMPRLMRAARAKPVKLFLPDIYAAMDHGVIDACPFSVDLVVNYNIHRLAKHITEVVLWQGPSWGIWIGEKAWQRLGDKHRKVLLATAREAKARALEATLAAEREARALLLREGVSFHPFPPEELAAWRRASPDFLGELIASFEARSKGPAARRTVEVWREIRTRHRCPR